MNKYRIGSFNLCKFSNVSKKDLDMICRIVKDNQIDILAIQEITKKEALTQLLNTLDFSRKRWNGCWEAPRVKYGTVIAAEGYAFIWNAQRISLSKRKSGEVFKPTIHNQYSHKNGRALIRNPYYGRFVLTDNEMIELRIINTHIIFSSDATEIESASSQVEKIGSVLKRKREFEILASEILPKLDDKLYDYQWSEVDNICRKPYTILMGDYNLNLRESGAQSPYIDNECIVIQEPYSEKRIVTVQKELTTIKKKNDEGISTGYSNNYDHFSYDALRPIRTNAWAVRVPEDQRYPDWDYTKYRDEISDHLMVVLELEFI